MLPSDVKLNHYTSLGVPQTATSQDIKRAYRKLALSHHPDHGGDEETIKTINIAYEVLGDEKKRAEYDRIFVDNSEDMPYVKPEGYLLHGRWPSKEFRAKIDVWKREPISRAKYPNQYRPKRKKERVQVRWEPALNALKNLHRRIEASRVSLRDVIPPQIWKWRQEIFRTPSSSLREVLNDPIWGAPLPEIERKTKACIIPDCSQVVPILDTAPSCADLGKKALKALSAFRNYKTFTLADISGIKKELLGQWIVKPSFVRSSGKLKSTGRARIAPYKGQLTKELGRIPIHQFGSDKIPSKTKASTCQDCHKTFRLWRRSNNCEGCGVSDCNYCLTFFDLPEYEGIVGFCMDCEQRVLSRYKDDFINALENKVYRKNITPKYLQLLDEMGWVNRPWFLRFASIFAEEGRGNLAVQCVFSASGGWESTAAILVRNGDYKSAFAVMKLSSLNWEDIGDNEAHENPLFALCCFLAAGVDLKEKALEFGDNTLGRTCLWASGGSLKNNQAYERELFSLYALSCRLQKRSLDEWVDLVNEEENLRCAEYLIAEMHEIFGSRLSRIRFAETKDHLRWRYLDSKTDFYRLLRKTSVDGLPTPEALICFYNMFPKVNWKKKYAKFLANGDPLGVAISHLGDRRTWPTWITALGDENKTYKDSEVLEDTSKLSEERLALTIAALIYRQSSKRDWIAFINKTHSDNVPYLLHEMKKTFQLSRKDMACIRLNYDRVHFIWPYRDDQSTHSLLELLIPSLLKGSAASVGYFRAMTQSTQYGVLRDEFIKSKKFLEAAVCHCLMMDPIPWKTLANKLIAKNQEAAVFFYSLAGEDLFQLGNTFAEQGNIGMAARCYIQSGNGQRLLELNKFVPKHQHYVLSVIYLNHVGNPNQILHPLCMDLKAMGLELEKIRAIAAGGIEASNVACLQTLFDLAPSLLEKVGILQQADPLCLRKADKSWLINAKRVVINQIKKEVRQSLYKATFSDLKELMNFVSPLTHKALFDHVEVLLNEFKTHQQLKSRLLIWRCALHLLDPAGAQIGRALNDLSESLFSFSDEDCISSAEVIIEFIDKHCKSQLKDYLESDFSIGEALSSEYAKRLENSPSKRMSRLTEKAASKMSSFEAAMVYYDKTKDYQSGSALTGNILRVAYELLKSLKEEGNRRSKYAYRRGIVELITNAYMFSHQHLCPTTRVYVARTGMAILHAAFRQCSRLGDFEEQLFEMLSREVQQQSEIAPLLASRVLGVYDFVYMNLIYRRFLTPYLLKRRLSPHPANFQYSLFEGTWGGWVDDKLSFQGERYFAMKRLLEEEEQTIADVEELMHWPVINRDRDGWVLKKRTPLNLGDQCFSRVVGVKFDLNTGAISFMLDAPADPMEALFSFRDLQDVFEKGITGSWFTLDPPDSDRPSHPFQEMKFLPKSLAGTDHLGTLLHTDILLKELSMQTEVSGKAPFPLRDASNTLLKRLPSYLRRKFKELKDEVPRTADRVHRFWIEAGDLEFSESSTESEIAYEFGNCSMSVKKHMMMRDSAGNLIDTEEDDEDDSPEAKFAKLMTDHYDLIGESYPELLRLKELAKIQAIATFALRVASRRVACDEGKIRQNLRTIRSGLSYAQCNSYMVAQELANMLKKVHGVSRNITSEVESWLVYGEESKIVAIIKAAVENPENEKYLRVKHTMEEIGFPFEEKIEERASYCRWVPAAFRKDFGLRAYGGVNLQAKLVSRGGPPNGGGPIGGSGGSGRGGARYVVRLDQNGRIHGTMVGVDRITGNTYDILKTRGCVQDQWNRDHPRATGVKYFWKTRYGGDVHHYTRHTSPGGTHVHYTNGTTTCINQQGKQTTYRAGKDPHRCNET